MDKFMKGVVAADVSKQPCLEAASDEFPFKGGDLDEAAEGVRERSRMFDERFGSALVLTKGGKPLYKPA